MQINLKKLIFCGAACALLVWSWVRLEMHGGLGCILLDEDREVSVYEVYRPWGTRLVACQRHCTDSTLSVSLQLENMEASTPVNFTVDLRKKVTVLTTLTVRDRSRPTSLRYTYNWSLGGRRDGAGASQVIYSLPFHATGRYQISQAPGGTFSHQAGSNSSEAIDWSMPEGTPVCAARAGTVTGVVDGYSQGGVDQIYRLRGNHVVVRHDDGTYAEYYHLSKGRVAVSLGDPVSQGQLIGYSGNTGFSSGPHLHFAVFRTLNGASRETLPLRFRTSDGRVVDHFKKGDVY